MHKRASSFLAPQKGVSRRQLLKGGLLGALAAVVASALTGCGALGAVAAILFCTPVGAILAIAAVVGAVYIYTRFENDDGDDSHPPLVPCPPPPPPPPPENVLVCFYNEIFPGKSQCPVMRISAKRAGTSDRPVWIYDAHENTINPQLIDMDPARMSYPAGFDAEWNGNRIIGSQLICSRLFFDTNGDGNGDIWAAGSVLVEFEIWYSNGDHINTSAYLGYDILVGTGTVTVRHGWMPEGAQIYSVDIGPLALHAAQVKPTVAESSDDEVSVDFISAPEVVLETMDAVPGGTWVPVGSAYVFKEVVPL